jgi:hypothetical protein
MPKRIKTLAASAVAATLALALPTASFAATAGGDGDAPANASVSPPPAPPPKDVPEEKEEEPEHVGIGAMGGVGFPRPLSIEALVRIERTVAFGAEYSLLPKMTISGVDARVWAVAADARIFPFRGAFFVGIRGGVQHASASTTLTAQGLSIGEQLDVQTTFINPRIGFLWGKAPGLTVGVEAGIQIPLSSSVTSSLPSQVLATQGLTTVTDTLGKSALPTLDLLRIGFLF